MSEQLDLLTANRAAPFARKSPTSLDAAIAIEPHLERLEATVLDAFRRAGTWGATCDEIEELTGLSHQTASARVNALARKRLIFPTGETRRTRSKRPAQVWMVTK